MDLPYPITEIIQKFAGVQGDRFSAVVRLVDAY